MAVNNPPKQLPDGWSKVRISDIALSIQYGYTCKSTSDKVGPKLLRITDIQEGAVCWDTVPYCIVPENEEPKYALTKGDILFARTGATVGKSFLVGDINLKAIFASYLIRLRLSTSIDEKYVFNFFQSSDYWNQIAMKQSGTGQPNVNGTVLSTIELPLPPLAEQHRIVTRIEAAFSYTKNILEMMNVSKTQLIKFRKKLLTYALSGMLSSWYRVNRIEQSSLDKSERLRSQEKPLHNATRNQFFPEMPPEWSWSSIDSIKNSHKNAIKAGPFGSDLKKATYVPSGYKVYGQEQVINGNPYIGDYYISQEHYDKLIACSIEPGDVLISLVGTVGKTLVIPDDAKPGIINPRLIKISVNRDLISPEYLKIVLDSDCTHSYYAANSHGETMEVINLKILRGLIFPLPSINEQRVIIDTFSNISSKLDELEKAIESAQISLLIKSVLQRAFCGRLVPQDPKDEPASMLLERVKVERSKGKGKRLASYEVCNLK